MYSQCSALNVFRDWVHLVLFIYYIFTFLSVVLPERWLIHAVILEQCGQNTMGRLIPKPSSRFEIKLNGLKNNMASTK